MGPFALVSVLLTASAQDRTAFYADADADGYGDPSTVRYRSSRPPGYTRRAGDCDDADARVHPGAAEVCNDRDDDCDGLDDVHDTDVVGAPLWYADMDDDGFGVPRVRMRSCVQPRGFVDVARDCNDQDARVYPGATERCNDRDDDCDGLDDRRDTDVVGGSTWYADTDRDDFGDPRVRTQSCFPPHGYIGIAQDCNDGDYWTNPLAFEFCSDGDDDDCDGHVDECAVSLDDAALIVESSAAETPARGILRVADMDGDGTGDLVVGGGAVRLLYGPASGTVLIDDAVTIDTTLTDDAFGWTVGGGDADGNGFDDLLVGAAGVSPEVTYVFLGPVTADRDASDADAMLTNVSSTDYLASALLVMSDHDGDGAADIAVGSPDDGDDYNGVVYVAPGTSTDTVALDSDATYTYVNDSYDFVGYAVADLGDTSGDGISDLAIGAPGSRGDEIFIVQGGSAPGRYVAADVASATMSGYSNTGRKLQAVDYDGDGSINLIARDDPTNRPVVLAWLGPFTGSLDETDATASWEWASADSAHGLGAAFAAADFDGNGETDLIIGASGNYNGNDSGAVFFQWGIASGVVDVGSLPYATGTYDGALLGLAVAALPDWNGDGIPEAAIEEFRGLNSFGNYDGRMYGFFSGSY